MSETSLGVMGRVKGYKQDGMRERSEVAVLSLERSSATQLTVISEEEKGGRGVSSTDECDMRCVT